MSKGSAPRPFEVDQKTFESNWETIFGKRKTNNGSDKHDDLGKKGEENKAVPSDSDRG